MCKCKTSEEVLKDMMDSSWVEAETLPEYLEQVKERVFTLSHTILNTQDYDVCIDQLIALDLIDLDLLC